MDQLELCTLVVELKDGEGYINVQLPEDWLIALGVSNEVGESVLNQEEVLQLATELGNKILKALKKSKEEMK